MNPLRLRTEIEVWPLARPFSITGYTSESVEVLVVTLERDGHVGRGESAGVYYRSDEPGTMIRQIDSLRTTIESGINRDVLQRLLPPGGARNALDCALWDLEAKLAGRAVWEMAGLQKPRPLLTTFTCGADDPETMASIARGYGSARAIKIKLTGEGCDADRVRAVRSARADVWLGVDANQGFSRETLDRLMPVLLEAQVALIEQPFPIGQEFLLDDLRSPIPVAADESVQDSRDLPAMVGRFEVVNIKLDKCGGLTEGLAMVRMAHELGLAAMVGNMGGTSLAMAPAVVVGQLCSVVDLDGPVILKADRTPRAEYSDGLITCPDALWGV